MDYAKYDPSLSSDTSNYFQETVLQEAKKILQMDREAIQAGGYRIYTTLKQDHQDKLEETIEKKQSTQKVILKLVHLHWIQIQEQSEHLLVVETFKKKPF